jgi:hypothetical protein
MSNPLDEDPMQFYYKPLRDGMHERMMKVTRAPEPPMSWLDRLLDRVLRRLFG